MLKAFILSLIIMTPRHELNKDPELLAEVAGYFETAGKRYNLEPSLLVYWAYRESSLKHNAVGKIPNKWGVVLNEIGYFQVHGKARKQCEAKGYNVFTRKWNIFCGAMLLDAGRKKCGSLERGSVYYASGGCRGTERTRKKIKQRLKEWRRRWRKVK